MHIKKFYLLGSHMSMTCTRLACYTCMYIFISDVYVNIYMYIYVKRPPIGVAHVDDLHSYVCIIHVCIYVCFDIYISRKSTFWGRACR